MRLELEKLTEPLVENFPVSSAIILGQNFDNVEYIIIEREEYVDGIFYIDDDDKEVETFCKRLKEAMCSSLIHDVDYIMDYSGVVILRKYE